jgi:hypothetical protein
MFQGGLNGQYQELHFNYWIFNISRLCSSGRGVSVKGDAKEIKLKSLALK